MPDIMNESYRKKLERLLTGEGDSNPEMRRTRMEWEQMQSLLRDTAAADAANGVKPFLADRVMRQIAAERTTRNARPEGDLWEWLPVVFRPVAVACLLLVVVLAAHNLNLSSRYEMRQSAVEAVLALPEISTTVIYDLDVRVLEEPEGP